MFAQAEAQQVNIDDGEQRCSWSQNCMPRRCSWEELPAWETSTWMQANPDALAGFDGEVAFNANEVVDFVAHMYRIAEEANETTIVLFLDDLADQKRVLEAFDLNADFVADAKTHTVRAKAYIHLLAQHSSSAQLVIFLRGCFVSAPIG